MPLLSYVPIIVWMGTVKSMEEAMCDLFELVIGLYSIPRSNALRQSSSDLEAIV
jgi:hypothetical protein